MKKNTKIIILIGVIAMAIAIIILSSVLPGKKKNQASSSNTDTNSNNKIIATEEDSPYIKITYETTSKVYKIEGTEHTITVYQDFPTVVAENESVQNKIQSELGKIANQEFEDYKKQVQDQIDDKYGIDASFMDYVGDLSLQWTFSNARNDEKVVSIKNESNGSLGGVPWTNKRGYSFSSETGELLKIEDIAIHSAACKKFIKDEILSYFRTNYEKLGIYQETLNNLSDAIDIDELTWYLSDSGLTVCFEKYTVSPDTFEYTINYSKLEDLVKSEYLK
ncbi:MAG: DUF3298 domain-containing protein [Clostridia bacterium]|nr:DUF3298 domain-containing protein [Clostridia bacterium]